MSTQGPSHPPDVPVMKEPKGKSWPLVVLLLLVAAAIGAYFYLRQQQPPEPPPVVAEEPDAGTEEDAGEPLPPLHETDGEVRSALQGLSDDPLFKKWLEEADLIRRFTTAVSLVAQGDSPRPVVPFLAPSGGFQVTEKRKQTFISKKSYARYDAITRAFASIDAQAAGEAFRTLRPLIERAHAEIAPPGRTVEETFRRAFDRLLSVKVPEGEVEVVPKGALWAFKDESLESLSAAEKHLLRMGPQNAGRIQAKLAELRSAVLGGDGG